ncbi:unnamed protein product [Clonostachys rhizophaga]|uniref:AB hydrolase-1 domain-containing protein n=1 Tax=Clonostachys rhizophaga TaxID=160324 RepID=A0A9N9VJM3_9HYPO|nr:unnamed protein product [Clonostachys rhizophaga]
MLGRVLLRLLLAVSLAHVALAWNKGDYFYREKPFDPVEIVYPVGHRKHKFSQRPALDDMAVPMRVSQFPHTGDGKIWADWDDSDLQHTPKKNITWLRVPTNSSRVVERAFLKVVRDHWRSRSIVTLPWPNGFILPLIRMRGKESHGTSNILVLPDGPGIPGTKMIEEQGEELFQFVGEKYNLVGFDARGVGQSDPAIACERKLWRSFPKAFFTEQYANIGREAYAFVRYCAFSGGPHYFYVNTPQVVEDINSIIFGLGQVKAHLWGFGYGTIVAQSYATRWPEKVGRMVFDGVSDMDQWYRTKYHETRYQDTDAVFQQALTDCIELGSDCALSKFGKDSHSLKAAILTFGKRLALGNYQYGEDANFTYNHMIVWIYGSLGCRAKFLEMARHLARFMERDVGDTPLAIPAPELGWRRESDAALIYQCNDGKSGVRNDYPRSQMRMNEEMAPFVNSSLFGIHSMPLYHVKRFWNDLKNFPYDWIIEPIVYTPVPPLLMTNTMDPFTPISSTKAARIRWPNSKVIQLTTYGHPTVDMVSECAKRHLRNYWIRGILPHHDVLCEAEQKPPPSRKKKNKRMKKMKKTGGKKKKGGNKGDQSDTEADAPRSDTEIDPSQSDKTKKKKGAKKGDQSDTETDPSEPDTKVDPSQSDKTKKKKGEAEPSEFDMEFDPSQSDEEVDPPRSDPEDERRMILLDLIEAEPSESDTEAD